MTTTHGQQHRTTTQGPPHWYPVSLQLRYKATSKYGQVYGFGQTRMMSSRDIIFASGDGLEPGIIADMAVAWPRLLDDRIPLQLVLQVTVTGGHHGVAEARIVAYDFHTALPPEAEQRTEAAAVA